LEWQSTVRGQTSLRSKLAGATAGVVIGVMLPAFAAAVLGHIEFASIPWGAMAVWAVLIAAHAGGLLAGLALAARLRPRARWAPPTLAIVLGGIVALFLGRWPLMEYMGYLYSAQSALVVSIVLGLLLGLREVFSPPLGVRA